jgi:transposase
MAALTLSPKRNRLGLLFRTIQDGYFQTEHVVAFLRDLLRHFRGRVIVVWDGWKPHDTAARIVASPRLETIRLPGYAPELNPVEHLWSRLKWGHLANAAAADSDELHALIRPLLQRTVRDRSQLQSFWSGAKLPLHKLKLKS